MAMASVFYKARKESTWIVPYSSPAIAGTATSAAKNELMNMRIISIELAAK